MIGISSLVVDEDLQILYVVDRGDVIDPACQQVANAHLAPIEHLRKADTPAAVQWGKPNALAGAGVSTPAPKAVDLWGFALALALFGR
ncbi:hypothetical protein [Pandoraea pulmonicola]|uniref:hypothetical protein n=1 Tax=Pandoraea pulmonicola TaxID=93221 RepID=UPI0011C04360|nr:hypothetical protein [Pandoraea pulmonicola]